jgi:hypothetical protein
MIRQDQLIKNFPDFPDFCGVGFYDHTLFYFGYAGGHQRPGTLHLYNADSARANLVNVFKVTEVWNQDVIVLGGFENGSSLFCLYDFIVDGKCYEWHIGKISWLMF